MNIVLLTLAVLVPSTAFAGTAETLNALQDYSIVFEALSLWITIIVALMMTVMVWLGGRTMHGGVMGSVLDYVSVGMTLMFLAYLVNVPEIARLLPLQYSASFVHDVLYLVAYVLMGLGVNKLFKIIKGQ